MDKRDAFEEKFLEKGQWVFHVAKIIKMLVVFVIVCMAVSTICYTLFCVVWIFCYDWPEGSPAWIQHILDMENRGGYAVSVADLAVKSFSVLIHLIISILVYRYFKYLESQVTPFTDLAIGKLRRTGILVMLLQVLVLLVCAVVYHCFPDGDALHLRDAIPLVCGGILFLLSYLMLFIRDRG